MRKRSKAIAVKPRKPHPTPEEVERWNQLWEDGMSFNMIGKICGRSNVTVANRLRGKTRCPGVDQGYGPRRGSKTIEVLARIANGETQMAVAADLGVTRQAINDIIKRYKRTQSEP